MRLALIYTPTFAEKNWATLRAQDKNVGKIAPLSLLYVAAIAEQAGHTVIIIDATVDHRSIDQIINRIKVFSPDLIGFTMTTYMFYQTLSWIKEIKKRIDLPILIGGQHLGTYPAETMTHKEIDYAVIGEAEITLPQLLTAIENGNLLNPVPGIAFRQEGKVIFTPPQVKFMDINKIPFPSRHLLDMSKYYNFVSKRKNFTPMITSRGCPFRCIFCDLKKTNWRMRSPENVIAEIRQCYFDFGIREIDFYDSSFTVDKQRVIDLCRLLSKQNLDLSWSVRTRVDCVDKEMLKELSKAGCVRIMYGIESSNQDILVSLHKGITIERIKKVIGWTKKYNMEALGFFIIGSPGETRQTALQTIKFACELPLDWVQFTRMIPFPATELYQMMMEDTGKDYWRKFVLNPKNEKPLPLIRAKITAAEAEDLVRLAYIKFYFRPKIIWSSIKKIKSIGDIYKIFTAAFDTFFMAPTKNNSIINSS
ncbi:MAG: radical SAM protein [Candidatus Gottesmanbacteria bacterium]